MRKIMAALDIGNSITKLIVAEMTKGNFNVLSVSETKTLGIKKNEIVSEEDLMNSIDTVLKDSESKLKIPIKSLITIIPSFDIEFTIGEAKIKINKEVKGKDIEKVLKETYNGVIPTNMELVNNIVMHFKLSDNKIVSNPINMETTSLSAKTVILMAPKKSIHKLLNIINKLNINIIDISLEPIGDYFAFKNDKINKQIGAIINIGGSNTTVSIFNKGVITNVTNIELGGNNIDNDIAYIYKLDIDEAKKLKESFSYASPKNTSKTEETIKKDKYGHEISINQQEISKIVYSRLKEILQIAKIEINNLTKKEISYIILTGGVTESVDFQLVVDEIFEDTVILKDINYLGARNNKFSSVIGLIKWYNDMEKLIEKDYSIFSIDEQEELSGINKQELNTNNSVLSKFFGYFLDD